MLSSLNSEWLASWLGLWLVIALALVLDQFLGEPSHLHPLVGFGRWANWLEIRFNRGQKILSYGFGLCAWIVAVIIPLGLASALDAYLKSTTMLITVGVQAGIVYFAIGRNSLAAHARAVASALTANNLPEARRAVSRIVSRDTAALDVTGVSKATVETVLENGSDAIFASLLWFFVGGLPGVVLHRLANTLDAMWGYRTSRFNEFGWAAARIDDVLNFIPARLTALAYALSGHCLQALRCWYTQASAWSSPNAGPVMAAGGGALRVQLGGAARYGDVEEIRPPLGCGEYAQPADIARALRLLDRSLLIWLSSSFLLLIAVRVCSGG